MIVGDESVQTVLNGWRPEVPEELQDYNWDKANVNELHVRKHLCESLFKSKCFLLSFWVPLLTGVIVYVYLQAAHWPLIFQSHLTFLLVFRLRLKVREE